MKQFETDTFKVKLYDDLLKEFTVKQNATLTAPDIWKSRDFSTDYRPGEKFFVLFETEENSYITYDAKRAAASDEYFKHVAALALCSDRVLESIWGNLFLKINRPKVPTRFFDDREKALEWLRIQKADCSKQGTDAASRMKV